MCFAPSPYPRSPERFSAQAQIIPSKPLVREGGGGRREKRGEHDGRAGVEEASTEDDRESIVKCEQSAACHTSNPIPYTKELSPQFEVEAPPTPTPTQAQVKATTKVHSEVLSQEALSHPATSEHVIVQQERKTESVSPRLLLPLLPLQQDEKTVFIKRTEGTSSSLPDARHQDISHVTKLQDTRLQDTRLQDMHAHETSAKWNSKLGAERGRSAWHGKSGVATTQRCVASARQASAGPIGSNIPDGSISDSLICSNISDRDNKRRSRSVGARKPRPPPLSAMAKAMASAGAVYAPPFEGAMSSNCAASKRGGMAVEHKERAEMPRQDIRKAPRDTGKRHASLTHDHLTSQRDHCRQKIVAEYHHHETHPASPAPPAPAAPSPTPLPPPRTPNDQVEKAEWVKEDVINVQESWMPSPVVATLEVLRLSLEMFVAHVFVSSCGL